MNDDPRNVEDRGQFGSQSARAQNARCDRKRRL